MKKVIKRIAKILGWGVVGIIGLIILWSIFNQIMIKTEKDKIHQRGEYVKVDGKNMNIYKTGEGDKTIVMMPSLGVTSPVLDFEPLINDLSKDYRVVVVEPFGYGYSDTTDKSRDVETIVEELRTGLKESGQEGPYILLPHSISGLYAMWYANHYPNEVEAVISEDCTMPMIFDYMGQGDESLNMPSIALLIKPLGVERLVDIFSESAYEKANDLYSSDTIEQLKLLAYSKADNKTVFNETNCIAKNIGKMFDDKFSEKMPVLFLTYDLEIVKGKTKKGLYEKYITNQAIQSIVEYDSETQHFIHHNRLNQMTGDIRKFINSLPNR